MKYGCIFIRMNQFCVMFFAHIWWHLYFGDDLRSELWHSCGVRKTRRCASRVTTQAYFNSSSRRGFLSEVCFFTSYKMYSALERKFAVELWQRICNCTSLPRKDLASLCLVSRSLLAFVRPILYGDVVLDLGRHALTVDLLRNRGYAIREKN